MGLSLRRASQRNNRQMPPAVHVLDDESQATANAPAHGARPVTADKPNARTRFDPRSLASRPEAVANLRGRRTAQSLMRSHGVVPEHHRSESGLHLAEAKRHDNLPKRLGLERQHETLQNGDRAMFADCSETRANAARLTPVAVLDAELGSLVGDDVLRLG